MYISGTGQPIGHLDALPLLLNSILGGGDVILISDGGEKRVFLDQVAISLAAQRCRVLWAAEVLPDSVHMPTQPLHLPEPSKAKLPDDEFLIQSYNALTVTDQTCDRIVLLISDAQALQHSALRYIEFMSRSSTHLQLVFCGTRKFLDLLDIEGFTWLRARLMAGLVLTLATPTTQLSVGSPHVPFGPRMSAASVRETVAPRPGPRKSKFIASMLSQNSRLAALAVFGLGGAAWLALCMQNDTRTGPTTRRQASTQSTTVKPLALVMPEVQVDGNLRTRATPEAAPAAPGASVAHSLGTVGEVREAGPASPSGVHFIPPSAAVPKNFAAVSPQNQAQVNKPDLTRLPLSSSPSSPSEQNIPAAPPNTLNAAVPPATVAPTRQALDVHVPQPVLKESLAVTDPHPVAAAGFAQGTYPRPSSSVHAVPPSSTAALGNLAMALPSTKIRVHRSEQKEPRRMESISASDTEKHDVPVVPVQTAALLGSQVNGPKLARELATPSTSDDRWLALQVPSNPGDGSQHYIGSYATDANGVRMFHSEP